MHLKIPTEVIEVRSDTCNLCESKCGIADDADVKRDPCSSCPLNKWGKYGKCQNFGLGDVIAVVAQPIAKAIDSVAGTNIQGCGACKQRQEALNKLIPNL
jgi:hypothetical protein